MPPAHYRGVEVLTLRQVDTMNGVPKGTTFRAFKQIEPDLIEGQDFFVINLHSPGDEEAVTLIRHLNETQALYASSQVAVLISEKAYARLQAVANLRS